MQDYHRPWVPPAITPAQQLHEIMNRVVMLTQEVQQTRMLSDRILSRNAIQETSIATLTDVCQEQWAAIRGLKAELTQSLHTFTRMGEEFRRTFDRETRTMERTVAALERATDRLRMTERQLFTTQWGRGPATYATQQQPMETSPVRVTINITETVTRTEVEDDEEEEEDDEEEEEDDVHDLAGGL